MPGENEPEILPAEKDATPEPVVESAPEPAAEVVPEVVQPVVEAAPVPSPWPSKTSRNAAGEDGILKLVVKHRIPAESEQFVIDALDGVGPKLTRSQWADLRQKLQRALNESFSAKFGDAVEGGV